MGASSGQIRAGGAFIELGLNDKASDALNRVAGKFKSFGKTLSVVGAGITAAGLSGATALIASAKLFADAGSQIKDAMSRTGLSGKYLQELKYAAEQTGASFDDVLAAARGFDKNFVAAVEGNKEAITSFKRLGVSVDQLKGMSQDDRFEAIVQALNGIPDPATRAATAMQILGKGGIGLVAALGELDEQRAHLATLGTIIPQSDIDLADRFGDALHDVWMQSQRIVTSIGAAVAEAIMPFMQSIESAMAAVIRFVDANRPLVIGVGLASAALIVAGGALTGLGAVIASTGVALGALVALFTTILGTLLQPAVLIGAAIAALVVHFDRASISGEAVMQYLSQLVQDLKTTAIDTFGGIADALAAGDIQLASKVLWAGLKLAWAQGTEALMARWFEFKTMVVSVAADAFYGVVKAWVNASATLKRLWQESASEFKSIWEAYLGLVTDDTLEDQRKIQKAGIQADTKLTPAQKKSEEAATDKYIDDLKAKGRKNEMSDEAERQKQLNAELAKIDAERNAKIAEANNEHDAVVDDAHKKLFDDIQSLTDEKASLQKELDSYKTNAAKERGNATSLPERDRPRKQDAEAGLNMVIDSIKSAVTFNVGALQSLVGGRDQVVPELRKLNKAAAKIVKNTEQEETWA